MPSSLLLHIETSSPVCSVALSRDGELVKIKELSENANHASMLALMLEELIKEAQVDLKDIDAIALSAGPGSYTGLRIGAATAKGLCYALTRPLIPIDSLQALAFGMSKNNPDSDGIVYCPTIDARRDEIYFGLFDEKGTLLQPSTNIVLSADFLNNQKSDKTILIGGSGALKCQHLMGYHPFEYDLVTLASARWMIELAEQKFLNNEFSDYVSFEPNYIKPAFITSRKAIF